jgi:peptidoglycan/LPS O-acetylase OafA/YrhL
VNSRPADAVAEAAAGGAGPRAKRLAATVPALDGFRGLAVLWIVLGHCWWQVGGPALDGGTGRDLFTIAYTGIDVLFIVSGFVLFLPAALNNGSLGSLRSYFRRRFARIVPAYYVAVAVAILFNPLLTSVHVPLPGMSAAGNSALLTHLFFLHEEVYGTSLRNGFGADGVIWTLSIEIIFYAVLPLVAAWWYRRPFLGLGLAFVGSKAWQFAATHAAMWVHWFGVHPMPRGVARTSFEEHLLLQFPNYMGHLGLGMTLAWIYARAHRRGFEGVRRYIPVVQYGALAAFFWIAYGRQVQAFAGESGIFDHWVRTGDLALLIGTVMLATTLAPSWAQRPFVARACRRLGDMSYGVYLFHLPLIGFALTTLHFSTGSNMDFVRMMAFAVPASLLAGYLSWRFVEQPARHWARKPRRQPKHVAPQPVAAPLAERVAVRLPAMHVEPVRVVSADLE